MYREIIINSRPDLVKVAVLEDGQLSELFIEKVEETRLTGNIYKGKVAIVLPGMQAAFVNTGIGRNTFLYVDDVLPRMDGIETDEEQKRTTVSIKNVLKTGQEILVQISKEPSGSKGARVTRAISLPGRFVVLMPSVDFVGVSRRVGDADERERLKKIAKKFKPESMGLIVRTVAEGRTEDDINADIQELALLWKKIEQKASQVSSPALLHRDLELVPRTIRDLVNDETAAIVADTKEAHEEIMAYLGDVAPHLMGKVSLFQPSNPIFEHYNVEKQIDKALRRKVWLKCGGYIVIDKTEALTSIDVNTGKFVGSSTLEDTVLKTNLEATREIAKQLRLRSIGGIIIIDFIDMVEVENRIKVLKALTEAFSSDKVKTEILGVTQLGLVEVTRQKVRQTLSELMHRGCTYCEGAGVILNEESLRSRLKVEIKKVVAGIKEDAVLLFVNPLAASSLISNNNQGVRELEVHTNKALYIRGNPSLRLDEVIVGFSGDKAEVAPMALPLDEGDRLRVFIEEAHVNAPLDGIARIDGFVVQVLQGAKYVGMEVRVEILHVANTFARAALIEASSHHTCSSSVESTERT